MHGRLTQWLSSTRQYSSTPAAFCFRARPAMSTFAPFITKSCNNRTISPLSFRVGKGTPRRVISELECTESHNADSGGQFPDKGQVNLPRHINYFAGTCRYTCHRCPQGCYTRKRRSKQEDCGNGNRCFLWLLVNTRLVLVFLFGITPQQHSGKRPQNCTTVRSCQTLGFRVVVQIDLALFLKCSQLW